jgi:hypothetical protein
MKKHNRRNRTPRRDEWIWVRYLEADKMYQNAMENYPLPAWHDVCFTCNKMIKLNEDTDSWEHLASSNGHNAEPKLGLKELYDNEAC